MTAATMIIVGGGIIGFIALITWYTYCEKYVSRSNNKK